MKLFLASLRNLYSVFISGRLFPFSRYEYNEAYMELDLFSETRTLNKTNILVLCENPSFFRLHRCFVFFFLFFHFHPFLYREASKKSAKSDRNQMAGWLVIFIFISVKLLTTTRENGRAWGEGGCAENCFCFNFHIHAQHRHRHSSFLISFCSHFKITYWKKHENEN